MNVSSASIKQELHRMSTDESKSRSVWQTERRELEAETRELKNKMGLLKDELQSKEGLIHSADEVNEESEHWQAREIAWRTSTQLLTQKIERESYRDALEQFGPGPHKVKFYMDVPRDSEKDAMIPAGEYPSFTIELYPLINMPHSIHLFLQQVHHGLWDGCSFVVNAPHILQAGTFPGGNSGVTYAEKIKAFEEAGLDVVSYQEYNPEHPHRQWTVGFAGRPGGPDFYINKLDNTANHGPGGQSQHDLEDEADPCFGSIQDGHDVLNRMYQMKTDSKNDWVMDNPVHIVKARIIYNNNVVKDIRKAEAIPHLSEMQGRQGIHGIKPLSPDVPNPRAEMQGRQGINGIKPLSPDVPNPRVSNPVAANVQPKVQPLGERIVPQF